MVSHQLWELDHASSTLASLIRGATGNVCIAKAADTDDSVPSCLGVTTTLLLCLYSEPGTSVQAPTAVREPWFLVPGSWFLEAVMSTEYYTEPKIPYEKFLMTKSIEIKNPPRQIYVMPHMLCQVDRTYIYVFKDESGDARFERFGGNDINKFFPLVIKEFHVRVFDEYGIEYSNCYD